MRPLERTGPNWGQLATLRRPALIVLADNELHARIQNARRRRHQLSRRLHLRGDGGGGVRARPTTTTGELAARVRAGAAVNHLVDCHNNTVEQCQMSFYSLCQYIL